MGEVLSRIRSRGEAWLLLAMLAVWSLAWDYNHFGSYQRVGRIKVMLIVAAACAAFRIAKTWHWTVALFYLYFVANWLHFGFSPWVLPINGEPMVFRSDGLDEIVGVTACLFLLPLVARFVTRRAFENTILAAGAAHSALGILNLQGIYPLVKNRQDIQEFLPVGLLGQPTLLGPFLAFAFGVALVRLIEGRGWRRLGYLALAGLCLYVALLTKSSMTLGSLAAAVVAISAFRFGALLTIGPIIAIVFIILTANEHDANILWHSGRLEPWADAYTLYLQRPWCGFGLGSWGPISIGIKEARGYQLPWDYLHNEPLQALFELGRVGVGLLSGVFAFVLARLHFLYLFREREALTWIVGLAVFGANSLANFTFHIVPHGPIFALCVYMILRSGRAEEARLNSPAARTPRAGFLDFP